MRPPRRHSTPRNIVASLLAAGSVVLVSETVVAADFDGDGIEDSTDNCPAVANPEAALVNWGWSRDLSDPDAIASGGYAEVSAFGGNTTAVRSDGSVVAWTFPPASPNVFRSALAPGLGHVVTLVGQVSESTGARVEGWGDNTYGQISITSQTPDFKAIAAGGWHSLALRLDGSIEAWGLDDYGQVSRTPATGAFTAIAGGFAHSIALTDDGSIVVWGNDAFGNVSSAPQESGYIAISAGAYHNLALHGDGAIRAWGKDTEGSVSDTPTDNDYTAVAAGAWHSLALRADGSIEAWGRDVFGQVSQVPTGTGFRGIAAGALNSVAIPASVGQLDLDADGIGDACDPDRDNDETLDEEDAFPFDADETTDSDGDGTGDNSDACPNDPRIGSEGDIADCKPDLDAPRTFAVGQGAQPGSWKRWRFEGPGISGSEEGTLEWREPFESDGTTVVYDWVSGPQSGYRLWWQGTKVHSELYFGNEIRVFYDPPWGFDPEQILTVGHSYRSQGTNSWCNLRTGVCGWGSDDTGPYEFEYRYSRVETIEVSFGTFEALVVELDGAIVFFEDGEYVSWRGVTGNFWVVPGLGNVRVEYLGSDQAGISFIRELVDTNLEPIPEPTTALLQAAALLTLLGLRRRRVRERASLAMRMASLAGPRFPSASAKQSLDSSHLEVPCLAQNHTGYHNFTISLWTLCVAGESGEKTPRNWSTTGEPSPRSSPASDPSEVRGRSNDCRLPETRV